MFKKIKESADFPPGIIGGFYIEFFSKNEAVLTGDVEIEKLSDMVLKIKNTLFRQIYVKYTKIYILWRFDIINKNIKFSIKPY